MIRIRAGFISALILLSSSSWAQYGGGSAADLLTGRDRSNGGSKTEFFNQIRPKDSNIKELLDLEVPGCGDGGSNYRGEVMTYDSIEKNPDLTMEPETSVEKPSQRNRANSKSEAADLFCIDSFERESGKSH